MRLRGDLKHVIDPRMKISHQDGDLPTDSLSLDVAGDGFGALVLRVAQGIPGERMAERAYSSHIPRGKLRKLHDCLSAYLPEVMTTICYNYTFHWVAHKHNQAKALALTNKI